MVNVTTINLLENLSKSGVDSQVVHSKLPKHVYEMHELSDEMLEQKVLGYCILCNCENLKLAYLAMLQIDKYKIVSCSKKDIEMKQVDYISCMVEIDQLQVICAHYNGTLVLYKKFMDRQLQLKNEFYQTLDYGEQYDNIGSNASTNASNNSNPSNISNPSNNSNANNNSNSEFPTIDYERQRNSVIIHISYFTKNEYILLRLERFDGYIVEQVYQRSGNADSQLILQFQTYVQNYNFIFRKFLRTPQILAGFVDPFTFAYIEKDQSSKNLKLSNPIYKTINEELVSKYKNNNLNTLNNFNNNKERMQLIMFDIILSIDGIFFIVCIYKIDDENEIWAFTMNKDAQEQNSLKLHIILKLDKNLGDIESIQVISREQNNFNYDLVVVFPNIVKAYQLYHITDLFESECTIKQYNPNIHYKLYHFRSYKERGFHLLTNQIAEDHHRIEYFDVLINH